MKKSVLLLYYFLLSSLASAQIVNIEDKRLGSEEKWTGDFNLNFDIVKDAQDFFQLENATHVQFNHKAHRVLLMNNVAINKSGDESWQNNGFQHLRYTFQKEEKRLGYESFVQHQYNEIRKIELRFLFGAGIRYQLFQKEKVKSHFGTALMYAYEEEEDVAEIEETIRGSFYLSFHWNINERTAFHHTSYYQPVLENFEDFRYSGEGRLDIRFTERLRFNLIFRLMYDADPAPEIPLLTYQLKNGIAYEF